MTFSILAPSQVIDMLAVHGWPVTSANVIASGTSHVFRCSVDKDKFFARHRQEPAQESLIVRLAQSPAPLLTAHPLASHTRWASALVEAGMPFAPPLVKGVLIYQNLCATLWEDLGENLELDYEQFGASLACFQDKGTKALKKFDLPHLEDWDAIHSCYDQLYAKGILTSQEHVLINEWIEYTHSKMQSFEPSPLVLVHDDLWSRNVIQTSSGVSFLDPDNFCWGRKEHDLNFLVRGVESGALSREQLKDFERGYGCAFPSLEDSIVLGHLHRLRWALSSLGHERIVGEEEVKKQYLSLWQESPRDV